MRRVRRARALAGGRIGRGRVERERRPARARAHRRTGLRPVRRPALPVPVAERLLHRKDGHLALTRVDDAPQRRPASRSSPSDYNRVDGFSPGATIVLKVPGLDTPAAFAQTGAVPITDLARTYDRQAPIVVINARTGRRQLIWAELDSNADVAGRHRAADPPGGKNFSEGERYIVALRKLRGADGKPLHAGAHSGSTATGSGPTRRRSSTAAAHGATSSGARGRPASRAATSTWPGTSRWRASARCRGACSRSATAPSPSSATRT